MRIWKFIFAKLPNNKHLEVFISLNYQKRKNKKRQKNKPPEASFCGPMTALFFVSGKYKQSKEKSKWRPAFALIR